MHTLSLTVSHQWWLGDNETESRDRNSYIIPNFVLVYVAHAHVETFLLCRSLCSSCHMFSKEHLMLELAATKSTTSL